MNFVQAMLWRPPLRPHVTAPPTMFRTSPLGNPSLDLLFMHVSALNYKI